MNTHEKAEKLIEKHSKSWLADKIGVSRPTIDTRLEEKNWRMIEDSEEVKIDTLYNKERENIQQI